MRLQIGCLTTLVCGWSAVGAAASWSGPLVDSKCYDAILRNVRPTDTLTLVDRDLGSAIRYCAPTAKTKSFAVVLEDWTSLKFDPAGNSRAAAELVRHSAGKRVPVVSVSGERNKNTVKVDSISVANVPK